MSKITVPAAPGYALLKRFPYKENIARTVPILAWQIDAETGQVNPITMMGVALIDRSDILMPHDEKKPMEAEVVILKTGEQFNLQTYLDRGSDEHKWTDDPAVWPAFPDPCLQDGGGLSFDGRYDDHPAYLKMHVKTLREALNADEPWMAQEIAKTELKIAAHDWENGGREELQKAIHDSNEAEAAAANAKADAKAEAAYIKRQKRNRKLGIEH